ncbi:aminoacyl tRNA synthase complex-interacting multifunctional protein 1 isoform X3 [Coregonus clupeaformis]|uniref:aminoacyl tRNA synthase complex-interacting multifunctional protein 1 isoform X3 n=1 Tax=Coregonus clupeaformis TaxID=59861 RepID=UPI001BDF91A1|nr:aminoacyl tRNA synthase complex-interacting multifunctional protein 1 isoform X3 [Coregonus clupeaformis]
MYILLSVYIDKPKDTTAVGFEVPLSKTCQSQADGHSLMFLVTRSLSLVKMSGHTPSITRLEQRAAEADHIIDYLKQQVQLLKEKAKVQATVREEKKLMVENTKLKRDIEQLKQTLLEKEKNRGEKGEKKPAAPQEEAKVDVSRLDMRVGRIVTAEKHPDADSLYVEQVDVGEAAPRTVVSGLVKHIPIDQMQNRMAVLLCNLKPAKMRGVLSQAMVMCASSPDKVEILDPPSGAVPGDRVIFQGFPGEPDKELNPKKKVWEAVQPDLETDGQCVATYKGAPFQIAGKGVCKAQTMSNSCIK